MRILLIATIVLCFSPANADQFKIPWKGDYAHNSIKHWSKDNPYDSGFSKNFKNGAQEEFGDVQKDGELNAEVLLPKDTKGPVPFMIVLHGCDGLSTLEKEWTHHIADLLIPEGFGLLILDSYTTRYVDNSCGKGDLHWGRRRADDAYSALDYLVEHKLANPSEVYLMGYSNGGTTTLVSMTKKENDHKYRFAAGFPIAPSCVSVTLKYGDYYGPMVVFIADQDDANDPKQCREMLKKNRSVPVQLIEYQGANHGFPVNAPAHDFMGWHLSYNPAAEKDMMQTITSAIKAKKFIKSGVEVRTAASAELK
jgi:dienelactone hydrolase